MKKQNLSLKTILHSMISTLLTITLLMGLIVVEKNTRKIGFADNNPWFICKDNPDDGHYIKIRFMSRFYTLDFSGLYVVTNAMSDTVDRGLFVVKNIAESMQK